MRNGIFKLVQINMKHLLYHMEIKLIRYFILSQVVNSMHIKCE